MHFVETALRNSLNRYFSMSLNRDDWYNTPDFLLRRQVRARDAAIQKIQDDGRELVPGRVVAALSFGFWVDMLSGGYSQAAHPLGFWDQRGLELANVFPHASPRDLASRRKLNTQFRKMRNLRNRVFHYESIYDDSNLLQKHASMIESIGWMNPELFRLIKCIDHFAAIYDAGVSGVMATLHRQLDLS